MKVTETLLLLGLGGVIAYLALSKKSSDTGSKSLRGGANSGSDFDSPSTRALEQVDVIETKPPINVTVNVPQSSPTAAESTGTTTVPQTPTQEPTTEPTTPTAAFVNSRRRSNSDGLRERMVILDNTNFPIMQAYRDDLDVDNY